MKRPKQLPAVDRNFQKAAAVPVGAKVGPSGWIEDLMSKYPVVLDGPSLNTGGFI